MHAVRRSFDRAKYAGFSREFYRILLAASPEIRNKFRNTQFETQEALLIHGVYSMLDYIEGKSMGKMAMDRLNTSHGPRGLHITPSMYRVWLDCFVSALRVTDPEFTEQLGYEWRTALEPGLERLGRAAL